MAGGRKERKKRGREGKKERKEKHSRIRVCDQNKTNNKEDATEPDTYSLIYLINPDKHYKDFTMLKIMVSEIK